MRRERARVVAPCERGVGGTRKAGEEVETGGLITSHTDAVHCRGDSALAYPEAYAIAHNHMRLRIGGLGMYARVCAYVWDCACLFRTC